LISRNQKFSLRFVFWDASRKSESDCIKAIYPTSTPRSETRICASNLSWSKSWEKSSHIVWPAPRTKAICSACSRLL
jgi:hypothetical protein